ncbi:hypothetical protein Pcinc_030997 [Petrolisthes cinctipes]|uniref:DUF4371 domain-containing protein n=1 Tax=Petrolisthes cinctipes TaxID=88211 RepID=A0AAE1EXK0_PETCI|nr:hypothetical protein Pcinc_030997 [Petrolisthes cinctipes]
MLSNLLNDIGDSEYSLIIDESTDISARKKLCVVVRYPSCKKRRILTSFLGLIELQRAVPDALIEFLERCVKLNVKRCTGLATDGCNTMVGAHNSVISRFRELNPNITHIKCICHSLQLCTSYAMKKLPPHLEFMVAETHRYFANSTLRQQKYVALYATINLLPPYSSE